MHSDELDKSVDMLLSIVLYDTMTRYSLHRICCQTCCTFSRKNVMSSSGTNKVRKWRRKKRQQIKIQLKMQKRQEVTTSILHGLKPHLSCYQSTMTELKASFKRVKKGQIFFGKC